MHNLIILCYANNIMENENENEINLLVSKKELDELINNSKNKIIELGAENMFNKKKCEKYDEVLQKLKTQRDNFKMENEQLKKENEKLKKQINKYLN